MRLDIRQSFLSLVRLGIGLSIKEKPEITDWYAIRTLAVEQGLSAIVVDGLERLSKQAGTLGGHELPPQTILLGWIGDVINNFEKRYTAYEKAVVSLAEFYNSHGLRMMILKGYGCSLNWLKPNHRPCGDIDIWLFGESKAGDALIRKECGLRIDKGQHIHTVFSWGDFSVENHYDLINQYGQTRNRELNLILKELAMDCSNVLTIAGQRVYVPSADFNSLYLISHLSAHFAATRIDLRQVLDWGLFVRSHYQEINWDWLNKIMIQFKMKDFYDCLNAICVEDLGFNSSFFSYVQFGPHLKERVLSDIINPSFASNIPRSLFPRIVWKWRRWRANAWKRELCYKENRWSSFWNGVLSHLLKPQTI